MLISLFGAAAGQSVVSYTGMFFALFYLQNIVRVNAHTSNVIVAVAIIAAQPLYPVVGALSDRIGRKKIMMAGMLLFVVSVFPMYKAMQQAAGNNVVTVSSTKDRVTGDIHLTPLTPRSLERQTRSCPRGASSQPAGAHLSCLAPDRLLDHDVRSHCRVPCGSFPGKVRYTSVSLPYHIGNGVFGGLLPLIGVSLCASTGNIYAGLTYPAVVSALCFVVGTIFLKESHGTLIWEELSTEKKESWPVPVLPVPQPAPAPAE